ncbi:acyltransferase [Nocardia sp. 348MFTsu5.1]|uniref:acyltransferase n=1 Tax=Nocardia sp. 348MFTsu5.1 TaxID=1172185 RepID=UPI0018CA59C0|nr:acyltransferase [Nocardia sp. 348MFTsu5.1]
MLSPTNPTLLLSTTETTTAGSSTKRTYLHHVDLIRATTFSLVIFVHCLTATTDEFHSMPVNSTALLLHFTRNMFFALTGYVLMYQNFDRGDFRTVHFWRRRIKLVIIPYLIWSFIYWVIEDMWDRGRLGDVTGSLDEFWDLLKWGLSGFHMYFLFVMLQVYLLFPLVLWLVRATRNHHVALLAGSFAVQVAVISIITYWQPPQSWSNVWWHYYATFIPYQFFIVLGSVAAVHREETRHWLRGKGWWLFASLVLTAAFALGTFWRRVWGLHQIPIYAGAAFQPTLLLFLIVAIICLYAFGRHWADTYREQTPRFDRVVKYASNRSFSVFLCHAILIFFILHPQKDGQPWIKTLESPWATILMYIGTIAGSLLLVEILRRLPGSSYLTGRPRLPPLRSTRRPSW